MKTYLRALLTAGGILALVLAITPANAIHTCGQPIGSCLAHWDPIVVPKPIKQIQVKPVPRAIEAVSDPIVKKRDGSKIKCYMENWKGVLTPIICPKQGESK